MNKIDEISVFLPAYNEEKNIKQTVNLVHNVVKNVSKKFEIIIINDGSKDKTGEIAKELSLQNKTIRVITHEKNKGYGGSLISGFYNSRYKWISFIDSDGQFDFSEINKLIEEQKKTNADLVIGSYSKRKVSCLRRINTFIWQMLIRTMFNLKVKDIDCGFKLIKKDVIEKIPKLESQRGAFISTEFLVKSKLAGFKIAEVPVSHFERKDGKATGANLNVIINSFKDLFVLKKKLRRVSKKNNLSDKGKLFPYSNEKI